MKDRRNGQMKSDRLQRSNEGRGLRSSTMWFRLLFDEDEGLAGAEVGVCGFRGCPALCMWLTCMCARYPSV